MRAGPPGGTPIVNHPQHRCGSDHLQLQWRCEAPHDDRVGTSIGSDVALITPVTVGDDAIVSTGSVITEDVEANPLAIARGWQVTKPGHAAATRAAMRETR